MKATILNYFVKTVLIVLSGWLSFSYLNYNQPTKLNDLTTSVSKFNLLDNSAQRLSREMDILALEQDNILEFMVWPQERRKILEQALLLTRQQLNQQPTVIRYWQRLLKLQYEYAPETEQLSWILENLYRLDGWNNNTLISLSRYCVPFSFNTKQSSPVSCGEIINKLPWQNDKTALARKIGITADDLDAVINHYKLAI